MDRKTNYLSLILLDALEDENESDINFILGRNSKAIDPSYVPHERGIAPMHYACGMQNNQLAIDVMKRFLNMKANPNCRSEDNMTPLHVAAMYGREEIVRLLLQYGAELDVYDNDRKTPVLYAIEECNFEVVQVMKDHIFLKKYEEKKAKSKETRYINALPQRVNNISTSSLPQFTLNEKDDEKAAKNKNLLKVNSPDNDINKLTPNRLNYNYDVTSPYYINITHRRHKPQPKFPALPPDDLEKNNKFHNSAPTNLLSNSMQSSPRNKVEAVNIFSLNKDNLTELANRTTSSERSRLSLIEIWREKVRQSRARKSKIKKFDSIKEMIDQVIKNDHLNYTNVELKEKSNTNETIQEKAELEIDSSASASTSSCIDSTEYASFPKSDKIAGKPECFEDKTNLKRQMSLCNLMATVAEAKVQDFESNQIQICETVSPQESEDWESSYQTVPEFENIRPNDVREIQVQDTSLNLKYLPKKDEYFLQVAETYVHTDDENGLVFYETKLLSNIDNKKGLQRRTCAQNDPGHNLNTTMTSQSTNITLPLDYETDALRAELTAFGEPPGPITKSTKKLYIKRLIKYKRKISNMQEIPGSQKHTECKFSVELQRTLKSEENFERIKDFMKYDTISAEYFESNFNKKRIREGHLKQSFIYMLIDPQISCNLPIESVFLSEFSVWRQFLQSIFYVGKGKSVRPYSHLYDAMKKHWRRQNKELQEKNDKRDKKIFSVKKPPLNIDMFKSPPQKSYDNRKLDRILNIWGNGNGVVCLHVFHNILPIDAYTREAAIIDALSLQHLTNCKRGDYYGPSKNWTMKEKKYFGIALLFKAMRIYLAEGESQLSPSDLI